MYMFVQGSGTLSRKSYSAPKPPLPTTLPPTSLSASPYSLEKDDKDVYQRQRQNSSKYYHHISQIFRF